MNVGEFFKDFVPFRREIKEMRQHELEWLRIEQADWEGFRRRAEGSDGIGPLFAIGRAEANLGKIEARMAKLEEQLAPHLGEEEEGGYHYSTGLRRDGQYIGSDLGADNFEPEALPGRTGRGAEEDEEDDRFPQCGTIYEREEEADYQ